MAWIEREWPLRGADELTAVVRDIGNRLARATPAASRSWAFVVVRSRAANAFAVGDGRIYVTDGAIDTCASESELAAMVAHEMAHELADHFCDPDGERRGGHRAQIGSLVQHIEPAKEIEADAIAVRLLTAAGYDARGALAVAQRFVHGRRPAEDEARIQALARLVETAPAGGRTDSEAFRRLKDAPAGTPKR